jgi:hypothetical protein
LGANRGMTFSPIYLYLSFYRLPNNSILTYALDY